MASLVPSFAVTALLTVSGTAPGLAPHDPDGRIREINKLIAKHPTRAILYVRRGELNRQIGHLKSAFRDYDKAAKLQPDLCDVHFARGFALFDAKRRRDALREFDAFLAARPRHGYALLMKARTLRVLGRTRESAATYDRALELLPRRFPEHFIEQAKAHAACGGQGRQRAISCLRRGIETLGPIVTLVACARELGADLSEVEKLARPVGSAAVAAPAGSPPPTTFLGENVLVPKGSTWRYLDNGTDQGTAWRAPSFDDSKWRSGLAELGYGDTNEVTVVGYGPNANDRYLTTYFRRAFQLPSLANVNRARIKLLRDDGAVVYLNGKEIARENMPAGQVGYKTQATVDVPLIDENDFHSFPIDEKLLVRGTNVLAVEIHQFSPTSDDISFDMELRVSDGIPVVERGPYLQGGGPNRAVIRWRTDFATETVAFLGSNFGDVKPVVQNNAQTTEHTAILTGLKPDTVYHYAVGNKDGVLAGGLDYHFRTAPTPGTGKKTRIWAIGDSGTANANAAAVRDAYEKFNQGGSTDLWLMLGDNAYYFGTDDEYQRAVFDMYPEMLRTTFLWPTLGNHDAFSSRSSTQSGPYYDIFDLPTAGEVGGLASGTEAYYSFDHGDIHFVCLNSHDVIRWTGGPMMNWLAADLAATKAKWVIAFWHHPPYSKGSHDSDNPLEVEMLEMRQHALPILENLGVDLVLTGHSHSFERSHLIDGHYSWSSTLQPSHLKDRGDGRETGHGIYAKPSAGRVGHEGAVYVVAGCSGKATGGKLDHPAMVVSLNTLGSMVIDVDGDRLDAKFLDSAGAVGDSFTIRKGLKRTLTRTEPTLSLTTGGAQNLFLDAGPTYANMLFRVAGSLGDSPGMMIGNVHLPLNYDLWFRVSLAMANSSIFQNTHGVLDFNGQARARISLPPIKDPSLIGLRLFHAYAVYDLSGVRMASNSVSLTIVK